MLHQQAWAFFIAFLAGCIAGTLFDIYRVIRVLLDLRKIGTAIGDFFSLISISLVVFSLLLLGNWGEIRLFVLIAAISGLLVYLQIASPLTRKAVHFVIRALGWTITSLLKAIVLPCRVGLRLVRLPFYGMGWISHLVARILEYLFSFPQVAVSRWYRKLLDRFSPPPP